MLKVYIATIFLLHGFAPVPGVSFGFMVAALSLLFALPGRAMHGACLRKDDSLFGVIFLLGLIPFFLEHSRIGIQNLIHSGLWLAVWTVCFWWVREWMLVSRLEFAAISRAAAVGSMLLAVSVLGEFAIANTTGHYLSDFIHFSINEFPQAKVLGNELNRPRGFTAEAGFSAIVFECLLPLSIGWLRRGHLRRWLFGALVLPAYLLLFSAASMLLLGVMLIVFLGLSHSWVRALIVGSILAITTALVVLTSDGASWLVHEVIGRKLIELASENVVGSVPTFSRSEAYALAWTIMTEQPWGIGWGGVSQAMADNLALFGVELRGSGLISIPLEIGASAGVLGMTIYLAIVWRKLVRLVHINSLDAWLTFMSLMWVALHHTVVLEFWFPMIWLSLALADVVAVRARKQQCGIRRNAATGTSHCVARAYGPA